MSSPETRSESDLRHYFAGVQPQIIFEVECCADTQFLRIEADGRTQTQIRAAETNAEAVK